jgi:xanthine dehydrogenase accessory factor
VVREIFNTVESWIAEGRNIVIATVVKTWGSSPQGIGAKMVISDTGEFVGSVSGGCVEGAVLAEADEVHKNKRAKLLHFGITDETAWDVGLACGGEIDVYLELIDENWMELQGTRKEYFERRLSSVLARVIHGPDEEMGRYLLDVEGVSPIGTMDRNLWDEVLSQSSLLLKKGKSLSREFLLGGNLYQIFFEHQAPSIKLIIVGGVHIAISLADLAKSLGYTVYIVDPRSAFRTENRFPEVEALILDWPDKALTELGMDRFTAVAVLTHDPKIDDPALRVALSGEAFYVGALGSKKTQEKRYKRLLKSGVSVEDLSRLRGPIGLNLGGRTPEEIALSVLAEIVAVHAQSPLTYQN